MNIGSARNLFFARSLENYAEARFWTAGCFEWFLRTEELKFWVVWSISSIECEYGL